jgi:hypothetical protein
MSLDKLDFKHIKSVNSDASRKEQGWSSGALGGASAPALGAS